MDPRIEWLGQVPQARVLEELAEAQCLIVPSIWLETFGRTMMESLAMGTPIVASRLGSMQEMVAHEQTGVLFSPGNASELAQSVHQMALASVEQKLQYRATSRATFLREFTGEKNYGQLIEIYRSAAQIAQNRIRSVTPMQWQTTSTDAQGVLP